MEKLEKEIESQVKGTIGYNEAENKKSFMVGVNVAFRRTSEYYEKEIHQLKVQRDNYKDAYESVHKDISNLASIIKAYTPE